ncbi:MAG: hypothetical protein AMXMBFR53_21260 [Gemmatimonadota bacterium]
MTLSVDGGSVAYPCGRGTIGGDWTLTPGGDFLASGSHAFGGGPLPVGGRPEHPARYAGHLVGERLTLVVAVTVGDVESSLGPFTLVRNGPEVLDQCK